MSTCKTENYQLHVWGAEDEENLAEINENFAKLDGLLSGKTGIITGTYTGTGPEVRQHIELGCQPLAVLVEQETGLRTSGHDPCAGLFIQEKGMYGGSAKVEDTGFSVDSIGYHYMNDLNKQYLYLAVVEAIPA